MAEITAKDIQQLRHQAGVGMMDAKKALEDSDGDFDKAAELLRERGLAKAAKRSDRAATEGTIGSYLHIQADHPVIGVLVELACETDFVAKSPEFNQAANDVAIHVAAQAPTWIRREDVPEEAIAKERDLIEREAAAAGKPEQAIPKIVEGRLEKFYEENVLYEQPFVNPARFEGPVGEMISQLAAKMGENIGVRRISRLAVSDEV